MKTPAKQLTPGQRILVEVYKGELEGAIERIEGRFVAFTLDAMTLEDGSSNYEWGNTYMVHDKQVTPA